METLNYLVGYNSKNELYETIRKEFGNFGSNQSVNDFLNSNNGKINDKDISTYLEIFKNI